MGARPLDSRDVTNSGEPLLASDAEAGVPSPALNASDAPALLPVPVLSPEFAGNPRYHLRTLRSVAIPGERLVTIYLPAASLTDPDRRFPAFYLNDGQNLFDGATSYLPGHTWRAHTTADRLALAGAIAPVILVGVANAGHDRMPEYTPTPDPQFGGGDGPRYGDLLVKDLKPLIDHEFRTLSDAPNTAIGGSSLGGLISLYLALEHRDVFGKVAVLSPSVWWNARSILPLVRQASSEPPLDIWLDMGTAEGARHLHDTDVLFSLLAERGWRSGRDLVYQRAAGAAHNEDAWADRFGEVLSFLFPAQRPSLLASHPPSARQP